MKNRIIKSFLLILCSAMFSLPAFAQPKVTKERMQVSILASVRSQVEAAKTSRTKTETKMSSQLLELRAQQKAGGGSFRPKGVTPQSAGQQSLAEVDLSERVHLYINIPKNESVDAVVAKLEASGVIISASNKNVPIIQVWATIPEVDVIAKMNEVKTIDIVTPPVHSAGPILSQGVSRMHSDVAQTVMNATGAGVKVGVLSDDCGTTENLVAPRVANGELTFNPVITDDSWGGGRTHEGLAMMEIVQDVAPQAQLYFATAFTGYVNFINNVQALANAGCKVITDDIIYLGEPVFEDGPLSAEIDAVAVTNGVIYTSAALNSAQFTWTGIYTPHATLQNIGNTPGGPFNVCDYTGVTFLNNIVVGGNASITLHWDDQFGNSRNDYDLFIVNAANNVTVASSTGTQTDASPGDPFEFAAVGAGTYNIIIRRTSTSVVDPNPTARIKLSCWQVGMSITNPAGSSFGHPTATNAIGCGAINAQANNYNSIESFSSQGPAKIINFGGGTPGGSRPVTVQRLKPDVASMDGVSTSVPGNFVTFFGTSAAAPHAAGVAAQLAGLYPTITAAAAQTAIRNGCIDYGAAGPDNIFGYGRTDAFRTIALYRQSLSPSTYTANFTTPGAAITDNTPAGITSTLTLSPTVGTVTPSVMYVSTTIDGHTKIGDLKLTLKSPDNTTITLMDRPVTGAGTATGKNPNLVFGDGGPNQIQNANPAGAEEVGFYIPASMISTPGFASHALGGTWTLTASDNAAGNTGTLKDWGIYAVEMPAQQQTLFGVVSATSGASSRLYTIDPTTAAATLIGNIGFTKVSAIATQPSTGKLYGIGKNAGGQSALITIDKNTGAGTQVGLTGRDGDQVSDMSFRSDGALYAFFEPGTDCVGTINLTTGAATIFPHFEGSAGSGLAFTSSDVLYFCQFTTLQTVNQSVGNFNTIGGVSGLSGRINAMAFYNGEMYANDNAGSSGLGPDYLRKINLSTAVATNIGQTTNGMDGLAWGPPPTSITVSLSPSVITIANQSMQTINATVNITGAASPSFQLLSVTSSDADAGTFAGDLAGDVVAVTGAATTSFQVRAETKPNGSGRFYTATYRGFDGATQIGDVSAKVAVLQNAGFIPPNAAGSCGLQLASTIPDFTGATLNIPYSLTSGGNATLSIYSLGGKELSRLINNAALGAGAGSVTWNGTYTYGISPGANIPNGTYVVLFTGCGGSDSRVLTINH